MGKINQRGTSIEIGGVERHLLFTLSVIDELQEHYDKPVSEVLNLIMTDERQAYKCIGYITTVLLNDEIRRNNYYHHTEDPLLTEQEVGWMVDVQMASGDLLKAILKAYGISMAEDDEDDDPDPQKSRNS